MKIVLLDTGTLGEDIDLSPIFTFGAVVEYKQTAPEDVAARISDAEVVVLNKARLTEKNLRTAKHLKLICITATGYDNIDTDYCRKNGIALCNVPGYCTDSVAQVTLAMALALASHLTEYRTFVHNGSYTEGGVANRLVPVYHELSSMTWGVIGGGAIGTRVAEIARAMGCRVLICRRKQDDRFEQTDINDICRRSDILSLHVPLTNETRGLISRERLATMKKNAILINVARGAVTDEEAVATALLEGRLGGFGSDVYSREPFDASHPFGRILNLDNVCLTPHMAWGSCEARNRCISIIAENMASFLAGGTKNRIV